MSYSAGIPGRSQCAAATRAAYADTSTWSSCAPFGNAACSSIHSSSQPAPAGSHTRCCSTRVAAGNARVNLSVSASSLLIGSPASYGRVQS